MLRIRQLLTVLRPVVCNFVPKARGQGYSTVLKGWKKEYYNGSRAGKIFIPASLTILGIMVIKGEFLNNKDKKSNQETYEYRANYEKNSEVFLEEHRFMPLKHFWCNHGKTVGDIYFCDYHAECKHGKEYRDFCNCEFNIDR